MSSAIVDTHAEAAELELAPLLIREPLAAFLDAHGLCGAGSDAPLEAEPVGEGHSNVTYLIRRGDAEVVLRRPPRPPLPPSAHDVLREARLLRAVESQPVRTPRVLATCEDPEVIGAPFYVMEKVDGDVITTQVPPALDAPEQHGRIADELIDAL
ncbi:MAG: phosphotransferase, partial [Conexibacter sp.]